MRKRLRAYADSDDPDQPAHPIRVHFPLTESLNTSDCMIREQKVGRYLAHAQDDLNQLSLRMFEGTFSLDASRIRSCVFPVYETLNNVNLFYL